MLVVCEKIENDTVLFLTQSFDLLLDENVQLALVISSSCGKQKYRLRDSFS